MKGYPGMSNKYEPAGLVHKGEYLIPKNKAIRYARAMYPSSLLAKGYALKRLRRGRLVLEKFNTENKS